MMHASNVVVLCNLLLLLPPQLPRGVDGGTTPLCVCTDACTRNMNMRCQMWLAEERSDMAM
jgi:hypothetical protein